MNKPLEVEFLPGAKRYFKSLKRNKPLLKEYRDIIKKLQLNPTLGTEKSGDLSGVFSVDIRYQRVNYELAYCLKRLKTARFYLIIMAGTRENFYQNLKRYIKSSNIER